MFIITNHILYHYILYILQRFNNYVLAKKNVDHLQRQLYYKQINMDMFY